MPNDNDGARCTYMLFSDHLPGDDENGQLGRWVKGNCSNANKFICQRYDVFSVKPDRALVNYKTSRTFAGLDGLTRKMSTSVTRRNTSQRGTHGQIVK